MPIVEYSYARYAVIERNISRLVALVDNYIKKGGSLKDFERYDTTFTVSNSDLLGEMQNIHSQMYEDINYVLPDFGKKILNIYNSNPCDADISLLSSDLLSAYNKKINANDIGGENVKDEELTKQNDLTQQKTKKSTKALGMYDEMSNENKDVYDSIMKKSYTSFLDKLTNDELKVLTNVHAQKVKEIKENKNKEDLTKEDVRYVALYVKLSNRYKKVFAQKHDGNNNDNSKVNEELLKAMHDKAENKSGVKR